MNYINAEGISKSYGDRVLFEDLDLRVEEGDKIALVAANGSGKSTLLKMFAGEESADKGILEVHGAISVGYLSQEPVFNEEATVLENIFTRDTPELNAIREYELMTEQAHDDPTPENLTALQRASNKMESLQVWDYEHRVKVVLSKLDIHHLNQPMKKLSGGQRKRVALAHILIEEPDLLILDEPTNHLDIEMVEWLEKHLASPNITCILVTHDRYFLDSVTKEILELDEGKLHRYRGNYEQFLEKKATREFNEGREMDKSKQRWKKELEWMRKQPKARTTKAQSRIDRFEKLDDKVNAKKEESNLQIGMKMNRIGGKVLELKKVYKSYGDLQIMKGFDYSFKKGERIGIIGKNGIGKTTFLNIISGKEPADSGKIQTGETIVFGYYSQQGMNFKDDLRMLEVVKEIADVIELADGTKVLAAKFLELFGFPPSRHHTYVSRLSGGEKRRLFLLTILVKNPNFLILDEPTNDLDLVTLQTLEEFLQSYGGCLLVVSHDRYFMDKLVDHLFVFEGNGVINDFNGNYSDYRRSLKERKDDKYTSLSSEETAPAPAAPAKKKALPFKEKAELNKLPKEIAELEKEKKELEEKLSSGETDFTKLKEWGERYSVALAEIEVKTERWLTLSEMGE